MIIPTFNTHEDVATFLRSSNDAWCRPMAEEFIEMCGSDIQSVDIEELNGWLTEELRSLEEGYEKYHDNNYGDQYV